MSFNKDAESHWKCLEKIGVLEKIYEVMRKNDFAELTLAVLDILKQSNTIIKYVKESKSENKSDEFRKEGNKAYGAQQYRSALDYYNRALLHAPDNSKAMTLAYSNRSVLLFKFQAYTACLKDIETCFAMECSKDIAEKLNTRKEKCLKLLWREEALFPNDSQDYFKFDTPHPDVPCVSTDVDFIRRNNVPTVIAAKDIKIGTIIAVEPAFSTLLNPKNQYLSCFYCQKMSLNLKPCKGCCFSLFCDDKCKDLCMEETHKIECRFMHALNNLCFTQRSILTFRAILRIKHLCKTWKEFITASYHVGEERLKSSTLNQIYDRNDPFSMLCFSEKREINFGSCYNYAFMCATFLDRLMYTPGFFPYLIKERNVAIRAVARMTMKLLLLFYNKIDLPNAALDCETLQYNVLAPNHGYFTFASKLKHCCDANLQIIALNNKLALMALHPIKKGKELTISYVNHSYVHMHVQESSQNRRVVELYRFGTLCHCTVCTGSYKLNSHKLNKEQKWAFDNWMHIVETTENRHKVLETTCKALEGLYGMSHTNEHNLMYMNMLSILIVHQFMASKNYEPSNKE